MIQKSDALFVLVRACFVYWSKIHTSLLSITTKLTILSITGTIVNFYSAFIYTSDIRKNRGDKKRKTKIHLLNQNQNCDQIKTAISIIIPSREVFFARRYNLVLLSMFTAILFDSTSGSDEDSSICPLKLPRQKLNSFCLPNLDLPLV